MNLSQDYCGKPILPDDIVITRHGLVIKVVSNCGDHVLTWTSGELVEQASKRTLGIFDIETSVYTGISGCSTDDVLDIFSKLKIKIAGKTSLYAVRPVLYSVTKKKI